MGYMVIRVPPTLRHGACLRERLWLTGCRRALPVVQDAAAHGRQRRSALARQRRAVWWTPSVVFGSLMRTRAQASMSVIGGRSSIKLKEAPAGLVGDNNMDVLYFGVAGWAPIRLLPLSRNIAAGVKSAHFVLRFDLRARALTAREPEKARRDRVQCRAHVR